MAQTHVCGSCSQEFDSYEAYVAHVCPKTGFAPTDPKHLGPEFEAVSAAALARGEAAKKAAGV